MRNYFDVCFSNTQVKTLISQPLFGQVQQQFLRVDLWRFAQMSLDHPDTFSVAVLNSIKISCVGSSPSSPETSIPFGKDLLDNDSLQQVFPNVLE